MDAPSKLPQADQESTELLRRPTLQPTHLNASYGGEAHPSELCVEKELKRPWSYGGTSGGGDKLAPPSYFSSQKQVDEFEEVIHKMATMTRCPPPYPGTETKFNASHGAIVGHLHASQNFTPLSFEDSSSYVQKCSYGHNYHGSCEFSGCFNTQLSSNETPSGCVNNSSNYSNSRVNSNGLVDEAPICHNDPTPHNQAHGNPGVYPWQDCTSHVPPSSNPSVQPSSATSTVAEDSKSGNLNCNNSLQPSYSANQQGITPPPSRQVHNSPRPSPYPSPLTSPNPETPPPSNPPSRRSSLSRLHQQVPVSPVRIHVSAPWEPRSRPVHYNPPPASVRSIHTNSRTSFKQQLMRTQQQQEEQRLKQQQQQQQLQYRQFNSQQQRSQAKTVGDPVSVPGAAHHVPGDGDAQSPSLQVQSLLENPTLYHVLQTRDRIERHQVPSSNSSDAGSPSSTPMGASTQRLGHPQVTVVSRSAVETSQGAGSLCATDERKSKNYSVIWPRSDPGAIVKIQHIDRRAVDGTSASKPNTASVAGSSDAGSFRVPAVVPTSGDNAQYFGGTPKSVEMTDAFPASFKEQQTSDVTMQCVDHQNPRKRYVEDTSVEHRFHQTSEKPPSVMPSGASRALSSGQAHAGVEQVINANQNSYSHKQLATTNAHQNHSTASRAVENQSTATTGSNSGGLRHMVQKVSQQFSSSGYSGSLGGAPSPIASASAVASVASSGLSSAPASFTSDVSEVSTCTIF